MQVFRDPLTSSDLPRGAVATIGNFDGVHLGHQKIMRAVVERARSESRPSVAITFEPHPLKVLHPELAPKMIQTLPQREEMLEALGVDALLIVPFTRDFSLTEPEDFVGGFLRRRLAVSAILLGSHFAFGRGKRGNLELLREMGPANGFTAQGIGEVFHEGRPIASTRIRQAIAGGDIRSANAMLGRPHAMDGVIARGDRMGRKIGYPTINLQPENELSPGDGVYFSRVYFKSFGREFDCVTNIGRRPTVYENYETTIESFVLDFSSDVYGEKIRLFFHDRVRDEMTFPSMMSLTEQIGRDIEATRAYFSRA
ncbi:MAG TPA: bifunctional riboflavin kinase/FAD synthetase [Thermoanaerobaculia bacterium]|nr:bifunctional riboflavin kinase/FAD synthetase [Thermoanaerobaculia bacterium]